MATRDLTWATGKREISASPRPLPYHHPLTKSFYRIYPDVNYTNPKPKQPDIQQAHIYGFHGRPNTCMHLIINTCIYLIINRVNNYTQPIYQLQQIMLSSQILALNNKSSLHKSSSRKNETKKVYAPSAVKNKSSSQKAEQKAMNRSSPKLNKEQKNQAVTVASTKTPKRQKNSYGKAEKATTKKQDLYRDLMFEQLSGQKTTSKKINKGGNRLETQTQRLQMLKEYLMQDADKVKHMKIISNQHVISEMQLTQQNLKKKIEDGYHQSNALVQNHIQQIQEIKNHETLLIKKHEGDIKLLHKELNDEKMKNKLLQSQLEQCQSTISRLQFTLQKKEQQWNLAQKSQRNINTPPQAILKIQKLETEVSELEGKVINFAKINRQLEEEIEKHKRQKKEIKKHSEQVLEFIRGQYSRRDLVQL